jgi:predicted solute-binding protein
MENVDILKVMDIVKNYKNKSNHDLVFAMESIQTDFNTTKENIIKLTHHLDKLELTYDLILKEYQRRKNGIKN